MPGLCIFQTMNKEQHEKKEMPGIVTGSGRCFLT